MNLCSGQRTMSTVPVPFQFTEILHQSCSQRIQVQITYKFQKVGVFFTDDRFVPILKEVPAALMAPVKRSRISRQKRAHAAGKGSPVGTNQEVEVLCKARNYVKLSSCEL